MNFITSVYESLTDLRMLNPVGASFDAEHKATVDMDTSRWYKGAGSEFGHHDVMPDYINHTVRIILREYAEERVARGEQGIPKFVPGPIGAWPGPKRVRKVSDRDVADYHRKEREGSRREMLALRSLNDSALDALRASW